MALRIPWDIEEAVLESDRNSHPKTSRINQSESDRNSQS